MQTGWLAALSMPDMAVDSHLSTGGGRSQVRILDGILILRFHFMVVIILSLLVGLAWRLREADLAPPACSASLTALSQSAAGRLALHGCEFCWLGVVSRLGQGWGQDRALMNIITMLRFGGGTQPAVITNTHPASVHTLAASDLSDNVDCIPCLDSAGLQSLQERIVRPQVHRNRDFVPCTEALQRQLDRFVAALFIISSPCWPH